VHSDADFDHPNSPFALVINVPLVTMTPENGSTEVWLGTHNITSLAAQEGLHGERASGRVKKELLEQRALERPPSQPVVKKGSLVIRDLRLWHAGKPNFTDSTRVMLALIHFAPWFRSVQEVYEIASTDLRRFRNAMQVEFSEELRPTLQTYDKALQIQRTFLPDHEITGRYLKRGYGNAYNFDQQDRLPEAI
jgi:ectoine hydroxylase-related dioxygenase (phytanoyl-CoA dioxygenase family)